MNWTNVKLIWLREVRDQLRDRRTLFMIAVLPLLLYPLLGMSFFQVSQFVREQPTKVLVVGMEPTADLPPLVVEEQTDSISDAKLRVPTPARQPTTVAAASTSRTGTASDAGLSVRQALGGRRNESEAARCRPRIA